VVALAGAPWTGKTALAQQLAARLNAPNVVATDAVRAALGAAAWASASAAQAAAAGARSAAAAAAAAASNNNNAKTPRAAAAAAAASSASALAAACAGAGAGLAPVPLWARADLAPPPENDSSTSTAERRLCEAWRDECRAVRRALAGDLSRALSDGRPLLLEGASLDPAALARDLGRAGVAVMLPAAAGAKGSSESLAVDGGGGGEGGGGTTAAAGPPPPPLPRVRPVPAGGPRPIFIPVIIAMDEPDHRLMAEDALARRQQIQQKKHEADEAAAFWRARALQAHLASYERQGLPVLRVRYGAFTEAVDALHDYALRCIRLSFRV
jgi:hypothetical protein